MSQNSSPFPPSNNDEIESRGSSVSADFEDEYNQLLQYAVVLPSLAAGNRPPAQTMNLASNHQVIKPKPVKPVQNNNNTRQDPVGSESQSQSSTLSADNLMNSNSNSNSLMNSNNNSFLTFQSLAIDKSNKLNSQFAETSSGVQSEDNNSDKYQKTGQNFNLPQQTSSNTNNFQLFDEMASQMKTALNQEIQQKISVERSKFATKLEKQKTQFTKEMKRLLDTLKSAQKEISNLQAELDQRDTAVDCLMNSLEKQKREFLARKAIYKWKDCLKEKRIEKFSEKLAEKHYSQVLLRKTLMNWKDSKNTQWKERVTLNCQSKAESMCKLLSEQYESKIEKLEAKLREHELENIKLKNEREDFQFQMKEAFMRGVCALNLEAMKVLSPNSSKSNSQTELSMHPSGNGNVMAAARRKLSNDYAVPPTKSVTLVEKSNVIDENSGSCPFPSGRSLNICEGRTTATTTQKSIKKNSHLLAQQQQPTTTANPSSTAFTIVTAKPSAKKSGKKFNHSTTILQPGNNSNNNLMSKSTKTTKNNSNNKSSSSAANLYQSSSSKFTHHTTQNLSSSQQNLSSSSNSSSKQQQQQKQKQQQPQQHPNLQSVNSTHYPRYSSSSKNHINNNNHTYSKQASKNSSTTTISNNKTIFSNNNNNNNFRVERHIYKKQQQQQQQQKPTNTAINILTANRDHGDGQES